MFGFVLNILVFLTFLRMLVVELVDQKKYRAVFLLMVKNFFLYLEGIDRANGFGLGYCP